MKNFIIGLFLFFVGCGVVSADYQSGECTESNFWYCDNQTDCEALTGNYYWVDEHCVNYVQNTHATELEALQAIDDSVLILRSDSRSILTYILFTQSFILLFLFFGTIMQMIGWMGKFFNLSKYF